MPGWDLFSRRIKPVGRGQEDVVIVATVSCLVVLLPGGDLKATSATLSLPSETGGKTEGHLRLGGRESSPETPGFLPPGCSQLLCACGTSALAGWKHRWPAG